MEHWEDEVLPSVTKTEQVKSSWDDEHKVEKDAKESWEDEDEIAILAPAPKILKTVEIDLVDEEHHQERIYLGLPISGPGLVDETHSLSVKDLVGGKSDEKTLDNFIPKSEGDFSEYADLISHKLHLYENSAHYTELLKAVMSLSITALRAVDAKEIASTVAAITNEKLKFEKEANAGKKKTGANKKQLHVNKKNDEALVDDTYDDYTYM